MHLRRSRKPGGVRRALFSIQLWINTVPVHFKSNEAGPRLKCHLTQLILLHLKHIYPFMSLDDTYQKMAQDVINMPHVNQYKSSVKRILHFISQMTIETGTILLCSIELLWVE
jgi:hypothetical protein